MRPRSQGPFPSSCVYVAVANARPRSFQDATLVALTIGDDPERYFFQKEHLFLASNYFEKALKDGNFTEEDIPALSLASCDLLTLNHFLHWLTFRKLPQLHEEDEGATCQCHKAMIKLWVFADTCAMPALQNEAMKRFLCACDQVDLAAATAKLAYELTDEASKMRNAVEAMAVFLIYNRGWMDAESIRVAEGFPGLFQALALALGANQRPIWPGRDWERYAVDENTGADEN